MYIARGSAIKLSVDMMVVPVQMCQGIARQGPSRNSWSFGASHLSGLRRYGVGLSAVAGTAAALCTATCSVAAAEPSQGSGTDGSHTRCSEKIHLLQQVPVKALDEMARCFPEANRSDLARFLIATKNNVEHARERYKATNVWRTTELVEMLRTVDISAEHRTGKLIVHGFDKANRPLLIWNNSIHQPSECTQEGGLALILAQVERLLKTMPEDSHQMTILVYSPRGSSFDRALIQKAAKVFTDHYPERLGKLVVFPTGNLAWWFWALISPFLPKKTSSKVCLS